jgi:hypothetical protein
VSDFTGSGFLFSPGEGLAGPLIPEPLPEGMLRSIEIEIKVALAKKSVLNNEKFSIGDKWK